MGNSSPYYDRFDPTKNRTAVAFNPDRPLQNSELNEMQSMVSYAIGQLGDSVFSDGDIVSGLDFDLKVGGDKKVTVNLHAGLVYLGGRVRKTPKSSVILNGVGDETINLRLDDKIITWAADASLLDPSIGSPSESAKGADRVEETVTFRANDLSLPKVYDFQNGKLLVNKDKPGVDKIMDVLAQRTYDESGHYRVSGFDFSIDQTQETGSMLSLVVGSGLAYVRGYRVEKSTSTRVAISKSTDVRSVINEPQMYTDKNGSSIWRKVRLNNRPVSKVISATAPVSRTTQVIHTGNSALDALPNSNVSTIISLTTSKGSAKLGTDFQLINGNQIQWIVGSSKIPASGESYSITYYYIKSLVSGKDYALVEDTANADVNGYTYWYLDFSKLRGDKPVSDETINISYNYFLARTDLVVLDANGRFSVLKGQPDTVDHVKSPAQSDPLTLRVGTVTALPNSKNAVVNAYAVTNMPFEELQKLRARVQTLEYNTASMSLDIETAQGHDPTALRGIFSDGFNSPDKEDSSFENVTENGKPIVLVGHSFEDATINLAYKEQKSNNPSIASTTKVAGYSSMAWGRLITAPYKLVKLIDQPIATTIMNVNPYMVYAVQAGAMKLVPSNDNWVDTKQIVINHDIYSTMRINRWWMHHGDTYGSDAAFVKKNNDSIAWASVHENPSVDHDSGTLTTNGGTNTIETAVEFMRSRTVKVDTKGMRAYADNLYLMFNGIRVPLKPTGKTKAGKTKDTLMADGSGAVTGSFVVPSGQRCGTVEVSLRNDDALSSRAQSSYTAQGTLKTVESIINHNHITVNLVDPLAQSFQIQEDRILAGYGLYFQSKSKTENVTVQLRGMSDGGTPSQKVYAERVLEPTEVMVSAKGTIETRVMFDDPIMAKAGESFAVVVLTNSPDYNMFVATMGGNIISTGKQLTTQAYTKGVLFSSSNAQTWTAHQDSDMQFTVYGVDFAPGEAVVEFTSITNIGMDKLLLTASYLTPANTGCKWEMRLVLASDDASINISTKPWEPVSNYNDVDPDNIVRVAQVRATFTASQYMSPMFATDDFSLMSFLTELKGSYFGKTVDMTGADFNTITVSYEQQLPSPACTVVPKIFLNGYDGNAQMIWETLDSLKKGRATVSTVTANPDINGFTKVTHSIKLPKTKNLFKIRIDLSSPSSFLRPRVKTLMCTMVDY